MLFAIFFRYYDYEYLLNYKYQITDIINASFSKSNRGIDWKNIYSNALLRTIFNQNDNVIIDEADKMSKLINDILTTKDKTERFAKFNKLRLNINHQFFDEQNKFYAFLRFVNESLKEFFSNYHIKNNGVLTSDADKQIIISTLLTIFKYMLVYPNHTKVHNDTDSIKRLTTMANSLQLQGKQANYLKGQQDKERLTDFTSTDEVVVYITSIDSFYTIYKKYEIKDKTFQLMIEIWDFLDEMNVKNNTNLNKFIKEMRNVIGYNIKQFYDIKMDEINQVIVEYNKES